MSRYSDKCSLCCETAMSSSLLKAKACKFKSGSDQYAAIETHLLRPSLPSVPASSFMGSVTDREPCQAGGSVVCTVAAVCHSVKNLGYIVHVIEEGWMNAADLVGVTVASSGGRECVVVSVSAATAEREARYSVHSSTVPDGRIATESQAIKTVLLLQSASRGLMWYWSLDLLGYSYVLNSGEDSMWALSVRSPGRATSPDSSRAMLPSSKGRNLRVLPFFYCYQEPLPLVVMGTGGVGGFCRDDLAVEIAALSRLPANRAYLSTASTGRCFCCEYMTNLHTELHVEVQRDAPGTHRLELSKQFWQTTKKN